MDLAVPGRWGDGKVLSLPITLHKHDTNDYFSTYVVDLYNTYLAARPSILPSMRGNGWGRAVHLYLRSHKYVFLFVFAPLRFCRRIWWREDVVSFQRLLTFVFFSCSCFWSLAMGFLLGRVDGSGLV